MGLTLSTLATRLTNLFSNVKDARILLVGLDGAGKTTLLYKFKIGEAGTLLLLIMLQRRGRDGFFFHALLPGFVN